MRKTETDNETKATRVRVIPVSNTIKNLQTWLRECLYTIVEDDETARFARVVARQLVKGNKRGEEAFCVDVPKAAGDEWCDSAAMQIYSKLQNETANLGGLQKYALYAYHSGDFENHISRFIVRIQGVSDDEDEEGLNSEGPDKQGLVSQSMRHTEVFAKTMTAMVTGLVGSYQATIARLAEMNQKLLDEKLETLDTIQELIDARDEKEVRMIQARAKAKGVEDLVGRLGLLLPAVANKVAGKPIFPVEDSSLMMMTRSLVTSIMADPERVEKLMALLSPEQGIALMNLYESISTKEENKELTKKPA